MTNFSLLTDKNKEFYNYFLVLFSTLPFLCKNSENLVSFFVGH